MKSFYFIFFISTSLLHASNISENELNSIYYEAILFVLVFGVMGIISYIYSSRHAKAYVSKKVVKELSAQDIACQKRVDELVKMLDDKLLREKEFEILKEFYLA
ncbi:MAG: hypothetical protein U9N33_12435 [Campylobacterota bacterium]|nr:hypothetical protein [Campylobacterota bacterium]